MAADRKALFVTAPLVTVKAGKAVRDLYRGDVITEDVSKESVDHLKSLGFVSETHPFDAPKPE